MPPSHYPFFSSMYKTKWAEPLPAPVAPDASNNPPNLYKDDLHADKESDVSLDNDVFANKESSGKGGEPDWNPSSNDDKKDEDDDVDFGKDVNPRKIGGDNANSVDSDNDNFPGVDDEIDNNDLHQDENLDITQCHNKREILIPLNEFPPNCFF